MNTLSRHYSIKVMVSCNNNVALQLLVVEMSLYQSLVMLNFKIVSMDSI